MEAFSSVWRLRILTLLLCGVYFTNGAYTIIISLILPLETSSKGLSDSALGLLLGIYNLLFCPFSLLFGAFNKEIGVKFMYSAGIISLGVCLALLGALEWSPGGVVFLVTAVLVRIVTGIAMAACINATTTVLVTLHSQIRNTLIGMTVVGFNVGGIVAPPIAGALYEVEGFALPFLALFAFVELVALLSIPLLTSTNLNPTPLPDSIAVIEENATRVTVFTLLRIPVISLIMAAHTILTCSMALVGLSLSKILQRDYAFSPLIIGFIFLILSAALAIAAPLFGLLIDKKPGSKMALLIGALVLRAAAFWCVQPAPFLNLKTITPLWLMIICLLVIGLTMGVYVIIWAVTVEVAKTHGYSESLGINSLISGIISSFLAFGLFIGALVGGMLVDWVGYGWTFSLYGLSCAVAAFALIVYEIVENLSKRRNASHE